MKTYLAMAALILSTTTYAQVVEVDTLVKCEKAALWIDAVQYLNDTLATQDVTVKTDKAIYHISNFNSTAPAFFKDSFGRFYCCVTLSKRAGNKQV